MTKCWRTYINRGVNWTEGSITAVIQNVNHCGIIWTQGRFFKSLPALIAIGSRLDKSTGSTSQIEPTPLASSWVEEIPSCSEYN